MIRLGVCTGVENAEIVKNAGFDYIELNCANVAQMSEADFDEYLAAVKQSPIPAESMNCMLPGGFVLCSEQGTGAKIRAYLEKAFERAEKLGIRVIVFGSGGARKVPEDMTQETAYDYLEAYLKLAAPMAEAHGIRIAIEPLRAAECNILNYVEEAQMLADRVTHPAVGALADLYHMAEGGDSMEGLDHGMGVIHTHIACPGSRAWPKPGDEGAAVYREFFTRLKNAGYEGRVSIEGYSADVSADAPVSFRVLNTLR